MYIYPIIQLHRGHCVSVSFGELDTPTIWHGDPVEKALAFVEQGAERLHVTDFDAVRGLPEAEGGNAEIVHRIIREAGVPVQVAGGLRTDEQVNHWIDAGAARVVIGTNAVRFPDWAKGLARAHPDQVIVSIDVWKGRVAVNGWSETAAFGPLELAHAFEGVPLAAMILTDIDRHLELPESSFALVTRFAEETKLPVIASGVVKSIDDVSTLRYLPGIEGVMIGRALYDRSVDLAEAISVARAVPEKVAQFQ